MYGTFFIEMIFANPDKVNDVNFEDMCNSEAVDFLRKVVQEPGPLTLTIAKCWDPSPPPMNHHYPPNETNGTGPGRFNEPIRPIDPAQESFRPCFQWQFVTKIANRIFFSKTK